MKCDFSDPKRFTEKLQWLKLNYRRPELPLLADKFEVRSFVKERVGDHILIPMITLFDHPDQVTLDKLPASFALKATHGSGWNFIVRDKSEINEGKMRYKLGRYYVNNYYRESREWAYKEIPPRFICEELILDKKGQSPPDIKLFCFGGKVHYIQVDLDRFTDHTRNMYDRNWNLQPFRITYRNASYEVPKPHNLSEMIGVAEKLASGFPFVRVDLYDLDGKIYFGEMTFYPDAGFVMVEPMQWELKWGELIDLDR